MLRWSSGLHKMGCFIIVNRWIWINNETGNSVNLPWKIDNSCFRQRIIQHIYFSPSLCCHLGSCQSTVACGICMHICMYSRAITNSSPCRLYVEVFRVLSCNHVRKRMRGTIDLETIKHPHDPSCSCFGLPIAVSVGRPPAPPGMGPLVGMVPPAYTPGWSDHEMQANVNVLTKSCLAMATLHRWCYGLCNVYIVFFPFFLCISGFCMQTLSPTQWKAVRSPCGGASYVTPCAVWLNMHKL